MYYVKSKLADGAEINVEITDENVFTRCNGCGAEMPVDIVAESRNDDFDLCGTMCYCPKCSVKK